MAEARNRWLPFVKTQALGNDFLLTEDRELDGAGLPDLARRICDRRLGVGADGLIVWREEGGLFPLRIINSDGSGAESSGNGLRCLAAYLFESGRAGDGGVRLRTVAGEYRLERKGAGTYAADMGTPELRPEHIPFQGPAPLERVVDVPIEVNGVQVRVTACATGNPHCSLFVDGIDEETVQSLGPRLEHHPWFPHRTNVEFIQVRGRSEIEVAFWERGAGRTPASGTGSCGATVASVLNGRTDRRVSVVTPHGRLEVEWHPDGRLELTASAEVVAEGRYRWT